jgi:hypothetical protein
VASEKVSSVHPIYESFIGIWERCRVAYDGEDAVKATGEVNLPRLESQTDDEYDSYKMRAQYPSYLSRIIDSFIALSMDKDAVIEMPEAAEVFLDNVGGQGVSISDLIRRSLRNNFTKGRLGMLVGKMDDAEHSHIAIYSAESIINWGSDFVVLQETYYEPSKKDRFVIEQRTQYRVLRLLDSAYVQEIWRGSGRKWELKETIEFRDSRNQTIDFIPFTFVGVDGVDNKVSKPVLLDFVNASMSWYRNSADIEHGIHFTALPWYVVSGVTTGRQPGDEKTIKIGSSRALALKDPQAKAQCVEFSGAGMKSIEARMAAKEEQMSELGAKILLDQVKGVEAAETKRIRSKADTSLAANIIHAVGRGIENSLRYMLEIEGFGEEVSVTLNTELISEEITDVVLNFFLKAVMTGNISQETFLTIVKTGKLPEDFDEEKELEKLAKQKMTEEKDSMDELGTSEDS